MLLSRAPIQQARFGLQTVMVCGLAEWSLLRSTPCRIWFPVFSVNGNHQVRFRRTCTRRRLLQPIGCPLSRQEAPGAGIVLTVQDPAPGGDGPADRSHARRTRRYLRCPLDPTFTEDCRRAENPGMRGCSKPYRMDCSSAERRVRVRVIAAGQLRFVIC